MSDDEEVMHSEEESDHDKGTGGGDEGPSEAELAMQKRRAAPVSSSGLDEVAKELLEANAAERQIMEEEIQELRERSIRRKAEREKEDKEVAQRRQEEEDSRKAAEEERKRQKQDEELERRAKRDAKMAEFDKWKNPSKPNFVITKKEDGGIEVEGDEEHENAPKQSKEQLEAEKKAILAQRIHPLETDGMDAGKLAEKAKSMHTMILRCEGEKYDLEKRFKEQQYDMMELAERARQINKVGKGGLKRVQLGSDETDKIQERFAGAPAKIVMFSQFERQMDIRKYAERSEVFHGATYLFAAERVQARKRIIWAEGTGLPEYEYLEGFSAEDEDE